MLRSDHQSGVSATGHLARAEQQTLVDVAGGFLDMDVAAQYEQFMDSCLSPSSNETGMSVIASSSDPGYWALGACLKVSQDPLCSGEIITSKLLALQGMLALSPL